MNSLFRRIRVARYLSWLVVLLTVLVGLVAVQLILAAGGDLDITFGVGGLVTTDIGVASTDKGYAVIQQPDGMLLAIGSSNTGGNADFTVIRTLVNGQPDNGFSSDGKVVIPVTAVDDDIAYALALQDDGKIIAAGSAFNGTNNDFALIRLTSTGILDTSFDNDGIVITDIESDDDVAKAVIVYPDGKLLVAGYGSTVIGGSDFVLVRYLPNGNLDTTFNADGIVTTHFGAHEEAHAVILQPDGKIVVAGHTDAGPNGDDFALARYLDNGSLDTTFSFDGKATTDFGGSNDLAQTIGLQYDGKIIAAGFVNNTDDDFALARYQANGNLDTTFDSDGKVITHVSDGDDQAYHLEIQPTGKILLMGFGPHPTQNDYDYIIIRYRINGSLDADFGTGGLVITDLGTINGANRSQDEGYGLTVQMDNKIVVVGFTDLVLGDDDFGLVRYESPNTPPLITDLSVIGNEDVGYTFTTAEFVAQFSDSDGDEMQFVQLTSLPLSGTLSLGGMPITLGQTIYVAELDTLVYEPDPDWFGEDSFDWNGSDGYEYANTPALVMITMNPVNDEPSFVSGDDITVAEDAGVQVVSSWATAISAGPSNEANQSLSFLLNNNNNALFLVPPTIDTTNGDLSFIPADDAFGQALVTAVLMDDGGTANGGDDISAPHLFTITVTSVNDAPAFVGGSPQTVDEDAGPQTVFSWANSITPGPANEAGQAVTFALTIDNEALFADLPTLNAMTGDLSYTPAVNAHGLATITVTLHDDGGTANGGQDSSPAQLLQITVNPVNDAPMLTAINKSGLPNTVLFLMTADFTANFMDVDGDSLTGIRIEWLPAHGSLTLGQTPVVIGQEILAEDLNLLQFTPDVNWSGNTVFGWNGSDGAVYALQNQLVNIEISAPAYQLFLPFCTRTP
ncbi:MAG: hypothetical protein H6658_01460 [Ardenticatenaceae bacterium]|nr:hypothetical protein [Ardenticatenaceae bacterium]